MNKEQTPKEERPDRSKFNPKNYWEDFEDENGNYECKCSECGSSFFGYKRRTVCKDCKNAAPEASPETLQEAAEKYATENISDRNDFAEFEGLENAFKACAEWLSKQPQQGVGALRKKITDRMNLIPDIPNLSQRGAYDAYLNCLNWLDEIPTPEPKEPTEEQIKTLAIELYGDDMEINKKQRDGFLVGVKKILGIKP